MKMNDEERMKWARMLFIIHIQSFFLFLASSFRYTNIVHKMEMKQFFYYFLSMKISH